MKAGQSEPEKSDKLLKICMYIWWFNNSSERIWEIR